MSYARLMAFTLCAILLVSPHSLSNNGVTSTTFSLQGTAEPNTPQSKQIVFVSERDKYPTIYLMNTDGTEQRALVKSQEHGFASSPSSSIDGQEIIFSLHFDNDNDTKI